MCIEPLNIHAHLGSYFFWGIRQLCSYPMQVSAPSSWGRGKEPLARFMGDVESSLWEWNIHEIKMRTAQMGADMRIEGWIIHHWAGSWKSSFSLSCSSCPMFLCHTGPMKARTAGQQWQHSSISIVLWRWPSKILPWGWLNTRSPLFNAIHDFASTPVLYKLHIVFLALVNSI